MPFLSSVNITKHAFSKKKLLKKLLVICKIKKTNKQTSQISVPIDLLL
jgi:hypothetical protein